MSVEVVSSERSDTHAAIRYQVFGVRLAILRKPSIV